MATEEDGAKPRQQQKGAESARPQPPVAEREPLTVTVIPAPAAEPEVEQPVRVEAPPRRIEPWRGPSSWSLILTLAAVLGFLLYRLQFSPFILRLEHGLQRRVIGERNYYAHRDPHPGGVAIRPH